MSSSPVVCSRCGGGVPAEARFCPACGASARRLAPGQTLDGKYEILEKTGEGGMGEVYKARHLHLDEIRIIKVMKPDALGEGTEPRRFQEEARIATSIRHPNVAALYDFSRLPDGSFYMVWEYIDGITLEAWLRRYGPLPAGRALDVAQQVLAGLEEIHAQGIVHRDLAPDNIMLRETRDGKLLAKIIDLGIAKRVAAETLQMTGTGMFVGKLKYCSPEQAGALAAGEVVDGRSDLYSFGVVLFEMLTGKAPFEADTPEGYLGKHLHAPAPPLDTTRIPAAIGPALASIVTRALEKRRDRRFRDAREFAIALKRLAPAAATGSEELPTARLDGRSGGSGWLWLAGGALALAAAAAALSYVLHRPVATRSAAAPAPTPAAVSLARHPTEAPDEVVVAPRIVEDAATPTAGQPPPTRAPTARPAPTPAPTSVPAPPVEAAPVLELPGVGTLDSARLRRMLNDWSERPIEKRAFQAVRLAYVSNRWIAAHPEDVTAQDVRRRLPKMLRDDSDAALGSTPPRPALAFEFAAAYLQLAFAPKDPEIERRVAELKQRIGTGRRGGRRF